MKERIIEWLGSEQKTLSVFTGERITNAGCVGCALVFAIMVLAIGLAGGIENR